MRVLQLVPDSLPAFRADLVALFGTYLPREGIRCDIVGCGRAGAAPEDQGFASVRCAPAAGGRLRRELAYAWLCLKTLIGARHADCQVIQVRDMVSIGLLAALAARLKRMPFTYWMSHLMSEGRQHRAMAAGAWRTSPRSTLVWLKGALEGRLLYGLVLPLASHVFVQSDSMRDFVVSTGIAADKITAVPMGVDTERALGDAVRPRRLEDWDGIPVIAYLGTLKCSGQGDVLIDMLAEVLPRYPDARLLLVGSADSREAARHLMAHADAKGVRRAVHATGWLPAAQAWELIRGADVAVSYVPRSRVLDGCSPTKLVEYLALGVPSVANDNPDQAALLQASGAGWLTHSTAAGLADAVCEVFADRGAALQRAARGPATIEAQRSYRVLARPVAARYRLIHAG